MKKNINVSTINALLEDRKKDFNHFMEKGEYAIANGLRHEAMGIIQVLYMSLSYNDYNDPMKFHDFYEEKMDGLEKSADMIKWELDHLR